MIQINLKLLFCNILMNNFQSKLETYLFKPIVKIKYPSKHCINVHEFTFFF